MLEQALSQFSSKMSNEFPLMNYGGCGIVAAHVAKRLEKIVPTRIVMVNYDELDISELRQAIRKCGYDVYSKQRWLDYGARFVHLIVEFDYNGKTYHYDSDSLRLKQEYWKGYPICSGSFTADEVQSFVSSPVGWNSTFDRDHIPTVKRRIKGLFSRFVAVNRPYTYDHYEPQLSPSDITMSVWFNNLSN